MATSIALALTTAAITACGGGGSSEAAASGPDTVSNTSSSVGVAAGVSSAASDVFVTTNTSAVTAVTTTDASTSVAASEPAPAPSTSTSTSVTTSTTTSSADADIAAPTVVASNNTDTQAQATPASRTTTKVPRPAGNTGTGFFVSGGKLYDAKGVEFRIRGVNRNHWDSYGSPTGLPLSGANTERMVLSFANSTTYNMNIVATQTVPNKIVPIPGNWTATCKSDVASLSAIVDVWVAQASTWTTLNSTGLINIANEWGPPNSTVWRDSYIDAIGRMRAAGYTGTLVVDSGGCGQDAQDIIKYGAAVLAADPQKNILFDVHVYGGFSFPATVSWQQDYTTSMAQLKATGLPIVLGEFGPGKRIGPSPTLITPEQVIATAEANGWGWMPWSWDDNNLANCSSDDNGFSMTVHCGTYKTTADLTAFGQTIVPILQKTAVKASIFN